MGRVDMGVNETYLNDMKMALRDTNEENLIVQISLRKSKTFKAAGSITLCSEVFCILPWFNFPYKG